MNINGLIPGAIYTKLAAAAGTVLWGTRIYNNQAPEDAAYPQVIMRHTNGGDLNIAKGRNYDAVWEVVVVAKSGQEARLGAEYLESALREQALSISGWTHNKTTVMDPISSVENEDSVTFYIEGAEYRIRCCQ